MKNKLQSLLQYIQDIFSLDTRSLAILRIGIGGVILVDLIVRITYLTAFHTDIGILPSDIVMQNYSAENIWSLHLIAGSYGYQLTLFLIHGLIATLFILGRKTRTISILLWIFTLSMHGHNPLILNGGDTFTRLVLFRGMFLPWGQQRSIDNSKINEAPYSIFSLATVGFISQLLFVYIFSAILKDHPRWTSEFTATYYALSLDAFRTGHIGERLYQSPGLMKGLTAFSYYLESIGLALLIIPWKHRIRRTLCIGLFLIFHIGLGLGLHLYAFPRIMSFAWLALLPSEVRGKIGGRSGGILPSLARFSPKHILHYKQKFTFLISLFLISVLLYSLAWNIRTTDFTKYEQYFPKDINRFGFLVRIDQYRNMFAPYPFIDNGRVQIEGIQHNGNSVNLLHHDQEFTLAEPTIYQTHLKHERRRKYLTSMRMKSNSDYRHYGAAYFCYDWNSKHLVSSEKITTIKRRYMLNKTLEEYQTSPLEEIVIYEADCP